MATTETTHTKRPIHKVAGSTYNKTIGKGIANNNTNKQRNKT